MTDPLDAMRRPLGSTPPDPQFRSALMARLEHALADDVLLRDDIDPLEPMELIVTAPTTPRRSRTAVLTVVGLATAAAVVLGLVVLDPDDSDSTPPATAPAAPTSTIAPTTIAPTTVAPTVPPLSDAEIAAAGILTRDEVGGNYGEANTDPIRLDRATGPGTKDPACAPFRDTFFESPDRPATVAVQPYVGPGAAMQQYVVVFPDEAGAKAMMAAVADPAFPACMSAVVTEAYTALDQPPISERTPLLPVEPPALADVGDEMVVLGFRGTFKYAGELFDDEGPIPFVRVGRAVMWMNPNTAKTVFNVDGYPLTSLDKALATAAGKLRAAQGG